MSEFTAIVELLGRYSNSEGTLERLRKLRKMKPSGPPRRRAAKQSQTHLSKEQAKELGSAYLSGLTIRTLAARYRVAPQTVSAILERQGIARRYRVMNDDDVESAVFLYRKGLSVLMIGEALGFGPTTVYRQLRRSGITFRDCQGKGHEPARSPTTT